MKNSVRVTAPSRLHFGLLRFAKESGRSFGGLGMMIDRPRVVVKLSAAERWTCSGPYAERALQFARLALESCSDPQVRAAAIDVLEAPARHSGLGSGTQLALAIAAGIRELCKSSPAPIEELVASVGRGHRSAVGSHGFEHGGFIWEMGRLPHQGLGVLSRRVDVPESWRVVLAVIRDSQGLSGDAESRAFEKLPPVPSEVTERLIELAETHILPAVATDDFDSFAAAVYEYGHLAGNCFAPVQGGPYSSPRISAAVSRIRELGIEGVGQSSWGPTLFAFVRDEDAALDLIERLDSSHEFADVRLSHSAPNNRGARVEVVAAQATADYSNP